MITDNALPGIAICEGANPLISSCSISDGRNAGVLVFERGKGVFDDCLIKGISFKNQRERERKREREKERKKERKRKKEI